MAELKPLQLHAYGFDVSLIIKETDTKDMYIIAASFSLALYVVRTRLILRLCLALVEV